MADSKVKIVISAEDKASRVVADVSGRLDAMERESSAVAERMTSLRNALAGLVSVGAGVALGKQFIEAADAMSLMASRIKLATSSTAEFVKVQNDLFAVAQRNSVGLEETSKLYARLSDPVKRLGGTSNEVIGIVDALSKALKISGATTQESAAAILQFGQAMGSGKLQGDEFKSLAEAAPRAMKAIAEGSGIAAENLKQMSSDGKLTADVVGNALLNSLGKLNAEAGKMPDTVGQSMRRFKNEVLRAVDEINRSSGFTLALSGGVGGLADLIGPIKTEMLDAFQRIGGWIERNQSGLQEMGTALRGLVGDMWEMSKAAASVAGFSAEMASRSGALKTTLEAIRIIIAGIEDGVAIIGAAFAKVGAQITDVLYKPLGNLTLAYGDVLEKLGSSSAQWWQQTGDSIRSTTDAAHQYADSVHDAFASGDSAMGKLNAELAKNGGLSRDTADGQNAAGNAASAAAGSFAALSGGLDQAAGAYKKLQQASGGSAEFIPEMEKILTEFGKLDAQVKSGKKFDQYDEQRRQISLNTEWTDSEKKTALQIVDTNQKLSKRVESFGKVESAANRQASAYETLRNSLLKQLSTAEHLSALEKLNVELQENKYVKLSQQQKDRLRGIAEEIDLQQKYRVEGEAVLKMIEDSASAQAKAKSDLRDQIKSAQRELETYGMTRGEVAEYDLKLIDQQIEAEKELNAEIGFGSSELLRQLQERRADQAKLLEVSRGIDAKDSAVEAAKAAADAAKAAREEWQKTVDTIDKTFHDAFVGMIEKSKAEWESFADSIANTFKSAVADEIYKMTIKPMVMQVVGSFAGNQAGVAGVAGEAGGIGQSAGMLSGVYNAYNGVSGGIQNAATAFATSGVGQWAGLSTTTAAGAMGPPTASGAMGYTAGTTQLTGSGSSAVASAGWIAAIVAAIYTGFEWQKRGWFNDNSKTGYEKEINEVATKWVSKYDRLFGHNRNVSMDASGIVGTFDLSGFAGQNWQDKSQKGGTFRSDNRWTDLSAINSDLDKFLDSALKQTVSGLQTIGKTLNIETVKAMEGFSHEFKLQLTENGDASKAGEKIAAEIGKVSDELVKRLIPNIDKFARFGESASQTFSRLNQEVTATDAILLAMGKDASEAFGGVGLASIAARENLIDLAGGLEKLASKTQFFYSNFYSQSEQIQLAGKQAQKALDSGFGELGLAIPTSREAFRSLVESQDLSTESGRKLFNALIDLSDEFKAISDAADDAGGGSKKIAEAVKQASEAATGQLGSIFDTFASDSQKLAAAQKLVNETFSSIGQSVPANAAAFLSLAQSIDPATEAGQGLITALAKVSNAFAYVQTAATTAAETARQAAINAANSAARGYFANLDMMSNAASLANDGQSAIDRMFGAVENGAMTAAQAAADAAANASQAWKSATQSLKSSLDNLRSGSLSGLSPEARYRLLQSQFATTSAAAQSGDLTAAGKLGDVATQFVEASRDYNASSEAFQRDRAAADAALDKSLQYASAQASLQDTIAKASRDAVTQLQTLNTSLTGFAAKALELLQKSYSGADRDTATGAVQKLAEAQAAFGGWFGTAKAGDSKEYGGGVLTRLGDDFAQLTVDNNTWYVRASESLLDVAKRIAAVRQQVETDFGVKLPSYAVGTAYVPEDQIAQIHKGEMIIPAGAAAQLRKYGVSNQPDSGLQREMLDELRANRQTLQSGNVALQQQLAVSNAKLAAVEKRLAAIEDGNRLTRASL